MSFPRHAIVAVDLNTDFFDLPGSKLPIPGSKEIIGPIKDFLGSTTADLVLFTSDSHDPNHVEYAPDGSAFPQHCVRGTAGEVLVADYRHTVIPAYRLEKNVFDMWAEYGIVTSYDDDMWTMDKEDFFTELQSRGIHDIVVIGVASDICVNFAIKGLVDRGFTVHVMAQYTKGLYREIVEVVKDYPTVKIIEGNTVNG